MNDRAGFFDGIAEQWDSWQDLEALATQLAAGLDDMGVDSSETVLDVGCGTGNLTRALLRRLSSGGRVVAVDFAPAMMSAARRKIPDPRVDWHICDALDLPLDDCSIDRVICFAVWPHLEDHEAVSRELARVLRDGGALHVWHLASRERINAIHAAAGQEVRRDVLLPAADTAQTLCRAGLDPLLSIDDESCYLVTAVKAGGAE